MGELASLLSLAGRESMDVATAIEPTRSETSRDWSVSTRIAFRFCFVYFGLYSLSVPIQGILLIPNVEVPDPGTLKPFRPVIFWVAAHIFGAKLPLVYSGSGSGDKTFDWTEVFCALVVALVTTAI